jgi:hypothetical protein
LHSAWGGLEQWPGGHALYVVKKEHSGMQIRSKFAVPMFAMLGVIACGDDDSGSTGGVSSNKTIADLSPAEAKSLCNALSAKFKKLTDAETKLVCTSQGVALSQGNKAECQSSLDTCLNQPATMDSQFDIDCEGTDGETGGVPADCRDVTVGDLTTCIDAQVSTLQGVANMVSCNSSISDLSSVGDGLSTPAVCTKLVDKCPDFADMSTP